ncbi:large ribosomal subunit protein mL37 [Menidia menidia]|uniref:Large ribosomal subunit protein mL37 n=1 Tax=Menidia menidia TaxID=238744 RepID=A0A8S4BJB9_9TELE|nr:unnamed protein product [Menidia menidia]CAG5986496.1 unnamed protein product [Menidia menidia]CAG5986503.1 unnamed protein product [Menidia menidia]CAG5986504.1 unnamed protein product [Menidia menidia]
MCSNIFSEAVPCLKAVTPLFSPKSICTHLKWLRANGGAIHLQAQRHFSVSHCLTAKVPPPQIPRERVEIPGLQMVTYGERMHFVPGLTKPVYPPWRRNYKDPRYYYAPPASKIPLFKEEPCYVYNQRTSALEGVRQAAWLTKTKMMSGFPPHLLSLAENPENHLPDQDERVQNIIKHARFWDTTEDRPGKVKYSNTLLFNMLHLCATLKSIHPAIGRRIIAENYLLAATWKRDEHLFQVRGRNGLLLSSMDPLPEVFGKKEIEDTSDHVLETFYPISPTIDLQKVNVYKEAMNSTGFRDDYPYPHAHTLYFLESADPCCKLRPEQFRARMVMFTFANALARAHKLYGTDPQRMLDHPITIQAVGTNGRIFQFLFFQLNTTDFSGDDGIKNQMWLDEDVELYDFAKVQPLIKRKQVKVPAGLAGYKPGAFRKFLALYLHGAV